MINELNESGCLICRGDIVYNANTEKLVCDICKEQSESNAKCINDHFICDSCHQSEAVDFIENYCVNTEKTNPMESVLEIMNNPKVKMHGPEHHFFVPAVILSAYYNLKGQHDLLKDKIKTAKERAKNILD